MYKKCSSIVIYFTVIILTMLFGVFSNVYVQVGCFIVLCSVCILSIDFDISHPYVWFNPIFTLYSIGYPLLVKNGYYAVLPNCGQIEANPQTLFLHWCALVTFVLIVSNSQMRFEYNNYNYKVNTLVTKIATMGLLIIIFIDLIITLRLGLGSKREVLNMLQTHIISRLGKMAVQLMPIMLTLIIGDKMIPKWSKINWIIAILITMTLVMLILGERSAIVQILIIGLLSYNYFYKRISIKKAFFYAIIILFFIIIGVQLKSFFLTKRNLNLFDETPFWVKIFNSEFACASINTTNILNYKDTFSLSYGLKYIKLFFYPFNFLPLSFVLKKIGLPYFFSIIDNSTWYHENILVGATSGYGFSMVADGYMEGGILGVIFMFAILALIVKEIYKRSRRSFLFLIAYIIVIPIFMYSIRASFLYFIGYFIKYIGVPLTLLSLFKLKGIKR